MRCKHCNVDLAETYTLCPLCGEKVADEEPKLEGIKVAPYSVSAPTKEVGIPKAKKNFSLEKLKAIFNL